mmetsp:Transcript_8904/g.37682  ORF Transcript_8904/g.37682 Transcript_8904/m.37682 type:complete len:253 (-) Transcript_8904:23-781(-)
MKSMQQTCLLFPSEGVHSFPPNAMDSTSRGGSPGRDASATIEPAGLANESVLRSGSFTSSLYRSTSPKSRGGENASHLAFRGRSSWITGDSLGAVTSRPLLAEDTSPGGVVRGVSRSVRLTQETDNSDTASRMNASPPLCVSVAGSICQATDTVRPPCASRSARNPSKKGAEPGASPCRRRKRFTSARISRASQGLGGERAASSAFSSAAHCPLAKSAWNAALFAFADATAFADGPTSGAASGSASRDDIAP